jgi:predicted aconitase with swiveling domain
MENTIKCRRISRGKVEGQVIVTKEPLSFLGGVDPTSGRVIDQDHELYQQNLKDKILVIPSGKGSTVGSYVIFQMVKNRTAPRGIVALEAEPIIATGAIMAGVPMVDHPDINVLDVLENGDLLQLDADGERIKILKKILEK